MAKKTNRVSINALERFCKETTPDIMQRTFSIGDETITYEVKFRLTLEESMRFIEDVVKEARMTLVLAVRNRNNQIKELLHNPTVTVDGNNKYGAPFGGAAEICTNNLERCVNSALYRLYGNDEDLINRFLEDTGRRRTVAHAGSGLLG